MVSISYILRQSTAWVSFSMATLFLLAIGWNAIAIAEIESFDVYDAGPFKVRAKLNPDIPKVGNNHITIWIQDKTGQPLSGAALNVVAIMPSMGSMPAMYAPAEMTEHEIGQYEGDFKPLMGGEWPLTIEIEKDNSRGSITFDLATWTSPSAVDI